MPASSESLPASALAPAKKTTSSRPARGKLGDPALEDLPPFVPRSLRVVLLQIRNAPQPSFVSTTSCFPWVLDGFLKRRIPGKNGWKFS